MILWTVFPMAMCPGLNSPPASPALQRPQSCSGQDCKETATRDIAAQEILSKVAANTALRHNYTVIYRAVEKRLAGKPYFIDLKNCPLRS